MKSMICPSSSPVLKQWPGNGQIDPTSAVYDPKTGRAGNGSVADAPKIDFLQIAVALGNRDLAVRRNKAFARIDKLGQADGGAFDVRAASMTE
jgi:hypothetical protein